MHKPLLTLVKSFFLICTLGLMPQLTCAGVILTWEAEISALDFGVDPGGLVGSHVKVELDFADGQRYGSRFGNPLAVAQSATMTVSGASQATSNGTFTPAIEGAAILFSFDSFSGDNTFFMGKGDNPSNRHMAFNLPLVDVAFSGFESGFPSAPSIGDLIRATDFPASLSGNVANYSSAFGGTSPIGVFREASQSFSATKVTSVPEPSSWSLLAVAVIGCARARHRKKSGGVRTTNMKNRTKGGNGGQRDVQFSHRGIFSCAPWTRSCARTGA